MILRSLTKHVKDQNWFAVGLDFSIVVVGVFVGLQVSNWNENYADKVAYEEAIQRLAEESIDIHESAVEVSTKIKNRMSVVQTAIEALETCVTDEEAIRAVNRGLNRVRSGLGISVKSDALDLLTGDGRLLRLQSKAQRATLREYAEALESVSEVSDRVLQTNNITEVDRHPLVGFSGIIDPAQTVNGVDIRTARLVKPIDEVCKDQSFVKLFYWWERTHVYQLELAQSVQDTVNAHSLALGLPMTAMASDAGQ